MSSYKGVAVFSSKTRVRSSGRGRDGVHTASGLEGGRSGVMMMLIHADFLTEMPALKGVWELREASGSGAGGRLDFARV